MGYKVDLETDFDREPFEDAWGGYSISFVLGDDADSDLIVFMTVELTRRGVSSIFDLRFGTEEREIVREGWSFGLDYSIEQSKRYIPAPLRPVVLELLLEAIACLVAKAAPDKFTMQSFYPNLPAKAMVKYHRICDILSQNGYEVCEDFQGNGGKRYWLFRRK